MKKIVLLAFVSSFSFLSFSQSEYIDSQKKYNSIISENLLDTHFFIGAHLDYEKRRLPIGKINSYKVGRASNVLRLDSAVNTNASESFSYHSNGTLKTLIKKYHYQGNVKKQFFDTLGRLVSDSNFNTGSSGDGNFYAEKFDSYGNLSEYSYINRVNGIDSNFNKVTISYNSNNLLSEQLHFEGNGNTWTAYRKAIYTYNATNVLQRVDIYERTSGQLSLKRKEVYLTASDNLSDTINVYAINNSQSQLIGKAIRLFDNNGNRLSYIHYNRSGNQWIPTFKTMSTYNVNNAETFWMTQDWDANFWRNEYKMELSYDPNGNLIQERSYVGDSTNWNSQYLRDFEYDGNDNLTGFYWYKLKSNQWVGVVAEEYVVDSTVSLSDVDFPKCEFSYTHNNFWFYNRFENKLLKYYNLSPDGNNGWIKVDSVTYHYSSDVTGISNLEQPSVVLYPNPATHTINITGDLDDASVLKIFNLSGKLLKTVQISNSNNQIDISHLNKGVYIVQCISVRKTLTKRFIKL